MNRRTVVTAGAVLAALAVSGCASMSGSDWVTLIDGEKGLENFNRIGDANWRAEGGAIVADKGKGGHLVTKRPYKNFQIRAEFWAETGTNSGIFFRASNPNKVSGDTAYEANIYDLRPGQEYATGGIPNFGKIPVPMPDSYKAGGKWNTYVITARDTHITVELNGIQTVTMYDSKYAEGPITLQFGNRGKIPGGAIKWRKVQIREL
ncbi:MAG TPA: DUF1080 domain-containing protein [Hyphomicrobiaceae bacterium]|nr:DUF1080 domain-containing protein [Hyphomicrobiaceae bacterium]